MAQPTLYPLYKEIFPPTVVEHVICANFTGTNDKNLIVAKASVLQIYKFVEDDFVVVTGGDSEGVSSSSSNEGVGDKSDMEEVKENEMIQQNIKNNNDNEKKEKENEGHVSNTVTTVPQSKSTMISMNAHLELITQYKLHGNIASMGIVKTITSAAKGLDSLILSFKDAKMSLLEFSLATNSVVTVSIHYYERDELKEESLHLDEEEVASKWPYLPSFVVDLTTIHPRLKNMIDMEFLNDYYEPTLAILFEPIQTWPGKLLSKKDSCSLVVVSIDLSQKLYPIIYSMDKLPHSCVKLVPIPKPVGGILIITANSLIHVNQTSLFGVSVNGYATSATDIPLDYSQEHFGLSLEGSQYVVLDSQRVLLCLRNGNMYLVELQLDGRQVSGIKIYEAGPTTLPSCACRINDRYFFLGSRLGDSYLMQYKIAQMDGERIIDKSKDPNQTTKREEIMETDIHEGAESKDRSNNHGKNNNNGVHIQSAEKEEKSFNSIDIKVCDTLINVGPISDMVYGEPVYPEGFDNSLRKELELVMCSGDGKMGALYVFHRNISPRLISSFRLDQCQNMWTVNYRRENQFEAINIEPGEHVLQEEENSFDKYLFMSLDARTMVLEIGENLQELEHPEFYADGPSIAVGTLLNDLRIVQIDEKTKRLDFYPQPAQINDVPIQSCCIYKDDTGTFATIQETQKTATNTLSSLSSSLPIDIDDQIDKELYGDAEDPADHLPKTGKEQSKDDQNQEPTSFVNIPVSTTTYWCTLHRNDGSLESRSHTGDIVIYRAFRYMPGDEPSSENTSTLNTPNLEEYPTRLALRFSRVPHEYVTREPIHSDIHDQPVDMDGSSTSTHPDEDDEYDPNNPTSSPSSVKKDRSFQLVTFNNIAGYAGVFLTGVKPAWLISSGRSYLRFHPMVTDGGVKCFTQFHNVNCQHGFLYSNRKDFCRMSELPSDLSYDMEWALRKVHLGRTVHEIEYHPEMQVYVIMTSRPIPFHIRDENGDPIDGEHDPAHFCPDTYRYFLELLSPVTWETVDYHEFNEDEQGLCVKCVNLHTKSTASGRKSFVAVGTGYFRGEDVGMRGTIYIFEIVEVVPEPDNPQTNHKYKMLCFEDTKGSVTAICDVNGYLLTCVGPKIFIRAFEDNDRLISVAFIDIQIYVNSVVSIKDFILVGDVYKSIWFLGFQEEPAKLALLGKDPHDLEVVTANFMLDKKMLYFVVSDVDKNVHLFQYAPYNLQSSSGQRLLKRGDFHVGSQVKAMLMMPHREVSRSEADREKDQENGHNEDDYSDWEAIKRLCLCGTLDGSIGIITPIPERMYKRMLPLYSQLVNGIQHPAGLNPKAYRLRMNPAKGVLDGDLLFQFLNLSLNRQREMTKQIGTNLERLMDDFLSLQISYEALDEKHI
ncbi:6133_t:CDS:10 [Ambispora gerdemannii]|uniref:6133_t:CDS:1 n=1 Tax=Ambispora gerdemannii TaxID=144530 RepID=A0A9N8VGL0_9GLOM|nr:6133_t:CDS:10 [Ambispora gerdemannii]